MRYAAYRLFILFGCALLLLSCGSQSRAKVYDCFLFFNEIELLRIRLEEMAPYVDHFVIVEAQETFRGTPKPLLFPQCREQFERFQSKIIYVPLVEHFPTDDPWERERYQRSQLMQGLAHCHSHDIIFVSDLDEIVRGSCVAKICSLLQTTPAVVCQQQMYYGYLNRYWGPWPGTVATTYRKAKQWGVTNLRKMRNRKPRSLKKRGLPMPALLQDAGWHFTSLGGLEKHIQKVEAYSHSELDRPELKTQSYWLDKVQSMRQVSVDDSFPLYIQEHTSYLTSIGFLERPHP